VATASAAASSSTSTSAPAAAAAGRPKKGGKKAAASAVTDEADAMAVSADTGAASSSSFGPALLSLAAHWPSRQLSLCFADGRWAVVAFAAHGSLTAALRGGGNKVSGGSGSGSAGGPLLRCSRVMHALTMSADAQTSYAPLDRCGAIVSSLQAEKAVYEWPSLCSSFLYSH
jgi:hypothetical protein